MQERINSLVKMGHEIIGPRIKDGRCVFCGGTILSGGYCSCKQSVAKNIQTRRMKGILNQFSLVDSLEEFIGGQLSKAHIPIKFLCMSFKDYITETEEQQNNLMLIKDYVEHGLEYYLTAKNLIFTGNFGNGKTMLMCIAGAEIIRKFNIQVRYANVYDLSEKIKESFDKKELKTSAIIGKYKESPILILDDIDKVNPTPFMVDLMYGIANYRSDNQLPTWINANHSLIDLEEKFYGQGTISRFFENSIKAKFTGENWRLRQ